MSISNTDLEAKLADTSQFQTEEALLSTAPANTRPDEIAEIDATADNGAGEDAVLESNGATAEAEATPGEARSQGAPPHDHQ